MKSKVWTLYLAAPMLGIGQSIMLIFTPILIEQTGISLGEIAIITALGSGLFFFSAPIWGKVGQRYGLKTALVWGLIGFALSFGLIYLSLGLSTITLSLITLIIARIIYGLFVSAIIPSVQAWLIHNKSDNVQKPLAKLSAVLACARLVAPYLGAGLLFIHWQLPILFLCFLPLAIALCLLITMPKAHASRPKQTTKVNSPKHKSEQSHEANSLIAITCQCATYGGLSYLLTPICSQLLASNAMDTSQMLASLITCGAATMLVCHLLFTKLNIQRHSWFITMAFGLSFISCLLIWQQNPILLYAGVILLSAGFAINQISTSASLCGQAPKDQQPLITAKISKYQTLGYALGATLLWLTQSHISLSLALLAGLLLLGATSYLVIAIFNSNYKNRLSQ